MKVRKLISSFLAAALLVGTLAGCNGNKPAETTANTEAPKTEATKAEETKAEETKAEAEKTEAPATEAPATEAGPKEKVSLKLWGSNDDQAMLQGMIDTFKAAYPEKEYDITLGVVGEPDACKTYLEDPEAAADVFAFANDQLKDLVKAGALYEITKNKDAIVAANMPGAVEGATLNDVLYGYPMTADNGYFMYYDKSVISEEQAKSLDEMLKACGDAGKKVFFDVSNGWYIASFFLGNKGVLGIDENGVQTCNFNDENGLKTGEVIKKFTADPAFLTGDDAVLIAGFGDTIAAGSSGTWNAKAIQEKLGDNYAATKLPTMTIDGNQVQMASFGGYKVVGVNSLTAAPEDAMLLAEWITNEQNQMVRFQTREIGPSNIAVSNSAEVKANVALAALAEQSAFSVSQNSVLGSYWGPSEAFGTAMEAKDYTKSLQEQLDDMVKNITTVVQ